MWLPPFPKHIPPFYIPFTRRASSPYAFAISLILYLFASCKMLLRQSSHHNTKTFSFPHRPPPPWLAQLSSLSTKNKPSFQFDQHHRGEFLLYLLPTMNQELHVATFERFLSDRGFRPSASHPLDLHLPPLRPNPVTHAPPPLRTHSSRPSVPSDVDRRQTPSSKTRERSRDEGHRPNLCRDEPEARPQKSTSNRPASSRRRRTRSTSPAPQWAHNAGRGVKKSATAVFQCEYCQMKFGRKHHKERHVDNLHRRSTGPTCPMCGVSFHQKPNLFRHMQLVHEVLPYRCGICGSGFSRRVALKRHQQNRHAPGAVEQPRYEPH